jgi:hypothetical protein
MVAPAGSISTLPRAASRFLSGSNFNSVTRTRIPRLALRLVITDSSDPGRASLEPKGPWQVVRERRGAEPRRFRKSGPQNEAWCIYLYMGVIRPRRARAAPRRAGAPRERSPGNPRAPRRRKALGGMSGRLGLSTGANATGHFRGRQQLDEAMAASSSARVVPEVGALCAARVSPQVEMRSSSRTLRPGRPALSRRRCCVRHACCRNAGRSRNGVGRDVER